MTIQKLIDEIADLELKCINVMNYKEWTSQEIVHQIMSLDNKRFNKYKEPLGIQQFRSVIGGYRDPTSQLSTVKRLTCL